MERCSCGLMLYLGDEVERVAVRICELYSNSIYISIRDPQINLSLELAVCFCQALCKEQITRETSVKLGPSEER